MGTEKRVCRYALVTILMLVCMTSCFYGTDVENDVRKVSTDFWLKSSITENNYSLIWSEELEPKGGVVIISESIREIGNNSNFIIAKRFRDNGKNNLYDTIYYIIDITNYEGSSRNSFKTHSFDNEDSFLDKRAKLHVPDEVTFSTIQ